MKKTQKAMHLFGRTEGKKLFIGLGDLARVLRKGKDTVVSTTSKLVDRDELTALYNRSGELMYACRIPDTLEYTSWELIEHVADKYFNLVGGWLKEKLTA